MGLSDLRLALVGPVPPPAGGMAGQTRQLADLLAGEGAQVELVATNAPYRPRWVGRLRGVRALFRLFPYAARLWRAAGRASVVHVMANSGWSFHLFATPAVWIARARGAPVIVNYRGGEAAAFLARSHGLVRATLDRASVLVVPSPFLENVFARHGIKSSVVANIVDLERFRPSAEAPASRREHILVARNLEPIYGIDLALRAFARVREAIPGATMTVAGTGPELPRLRALCAELGVEGAVDFCGRLERDAIAERLRVSRVALNPSRVDNMPNSILEAMASRVPVVSTPAGGVPFIVRDGVTGLLVAPDPEAMAAGIVRVLRDDDLARRLSDAAYADVQQYAWPRVRPRWLEVYASACAPRNAWAA